MNADEMTKFGIPVELHTNPSLVEAKDIASLAKAYVDTKAFVGSSIRVPGADAGEKDRQEFREKLKKASPDLIDVPADPVKFAEVEGSLFERLGRPKEAKEYPSLKESKIEVGEGVKISEDELRATAHKLGFTKKQYLAFAAEVVAERTKEAQLSSEARGALKKELGDAFDDRLLAAASAAKKMGATDNLVTAIRTGNVSPEQARLWIGVAKSLGTEGAEFGREGGGNGKMTPAEANAQIAELNANPALWDRSHPDQKRLAKKLLELTKVSIGEQ